MVVSGFARWSRTTQFVHGPDTHGCAYGADANRTAYTDRPESLGGHKAEICQGHGKNCRALTGPADHGVGGWCAVNLRLKGGLSVG